MSDNHKVKLSASYVLPALLLSMLLPANLQAQNATADGYRGIWFELGQPSAYGDKYSGGLGTYTSSHIPIAVYSKQAQKTFFVYGGTTRAEQKHLLIMISYFDHLHQTVPRPVIVYDKDGVNDPHDNASLSVDDKGYIWVFVSGRNTTRPGLRFKSRSPYSISGFEKIKEGEMTYPQPWYISGKGFFYLFTKYTKGRELYWSTSADGMAWSPEQKLAGMGGHYQVSNVHNGKIYSAFNYHPGGDVDKRTNLYLVQTADMGKTWTAIDGAPAQPPLTDIHSNTQVKDYAAEGKLVYLNDLNFDAAGNPVILAVVSRDFKPGPKGDPREWTVIQWKNGHWNFTVVTASTHNYDMGSLYIEGNLWRIIGPTGTGPQRYGTGGEMALWESTDEGKTWKKQKLTQASRYNHSYARRPLYAHPGFYALWTDGDADKLSPSHLYFCDRKGKTWMLPYEMKSGVEKPVLYKAPAPVKKPER